MLGHQVTDFIGRQGWLDSAGKPLQQAIRRTFQAGGAVGRQIKNVLHGNWLGHPLHPVLTDVPLGAWTTALALDVLDAGDDSKRYAPGADAAIALGMAGAVGSILSGLAEYQHIAGKARRVGLVHGMLNLGITALYGASLLARRRQARALGRVLSAAGYAIALLSAYLGGELVYNMNIGVSHAPAEPPPQEFRPVLGDTELGEGQLRAVEIDGTPILLARHNGRVYALADSCSHLGCPLSEGHLEGNSVRCHCHGSRFALDTGEVLDSPASVPQPVYETRINNGKIEVRFVGARLTERSIGA